MSVLTMRSIGIAFMFALAATTASAAQPNDPHVVVRPALPAGGLHVVTGSITSIAGNKLGLQLRGGQTIVIDASQAIREQRVTELYVARPVTIYGHYSGSIFDAWSIQHARPKATAWPADR